MCPFPLPAVETRFVLCEHCGSEGRIEHGYPNAPHPDWVEVCPVCGGEGVEEVAVYPITMADLSRAARGYPRPSLKDQLLASMKETT